MMFADAEGVDAELVGQHRFRDDIAKAFRLGAVTARPVERHVTKGIESEFDVRHAI